eukprot:17313-Heterococcus_DN1.PRE.1
MAIGSGSLVLFNMLSTAFMAHPNAGTTAISATTAATTSATAAANCSTAALYLYQFSYAAFGLAAAVYATVMCAGYATFGQSASGLILNNYHKRLQLKQCHDAVSVLAVRVTGRVRLADTQQPDL